jgi:TonB family protein
MNAAKVSSALFVTLAAPAFAQTVSPTVDVFVSPDQPAATGHWRYLLRSSKQPYYCHEAGANTRCVDHEVVVENETQETLECRYQVDYKSADGTLVKSFDAPMLVFARTRPQVHAWITAPEVRSQVSWLSCRARAPYKRLAKVSGCSYEMLGKPFESYYPDEAKLKSLQGPVIVAFELTSRYGPAKGAAVVESSLAPLLDAAALRFIRDQDFRTNCPGQYDVLMRFRLQDQLAARTPAPAPD